MSVAALFDANEFVGWVSEDGDGATIDAIAALPFDGKRGRGFHDSHGFVLGLPTNGQLKNWRGGKPADGCVRDPECTFDT